MRAGPSRDSADATMNLVQRKEILRSMGLFRTDSDISLESEKSYDPLFKKTEVYKNLTYLTFNLVWMFISASANVILFVLNTYEVLFDNNFFNNVEVFIMVVICNALVIADIIAAIIHHTWKEYATLKNYKPRPKILIIIDTISITSMFVRLVPQIRDLKWIAITEIAFISFRLYRVLNFFAVVSKTPGHDTFGVLLTKYGSIIFIMVHAYSCIIKAVSCYKCYPDKKDWTSKVDDTIYFNGATPSKWYIVCLYFIMDSASSVGFGDIHAITDVEQAILTLVMLTSFFLINGTFLGAMTSVQVESYRRHSNFANRLAIISKVMNHPRITKSLKAKVMNFYHMFWQQQKSIRYSYLFEELPATFQQQVNLDKYWNALKQTYLLKNIHPAFRRAIATKMTTEIFTVGEVIFKQGQQRDSMIYVLRGNVQILSSEDGESPILTLGIGTCIGEINLIYSFPSPVQVVASSYCEIQRLRKLDFWKVAAVYYRLGEVFQIHKRLEKKINDAYDAENLKGFMNEVGSDDSIAEGRALKSVKGQLATEDPKASSSFYLDSRRRSLQKKLSNEQEIYSNLYILSLHQTTLKHSDEIFLQTSWPWVLQPQSVFLTIWEYLLCTCILLVMILYPYQISFAKEFPSFMTLIMLTIDGVYLIDIIIQIFTAIEDENGVITKVYDIFTIRCRQLSFIVDIISIIPLTAFATGFKITEKQRLLTIMSVNRLFKFHRVVILFKKLGASFDVNIAVVRCTKYVVYFLTLSYLMGAIFYMIACFMECLDHSWIKVIEEEDNQMSGTRYKHSFELSMYFGALVISQIGFGDIVPHTMLEVCCIMLFFIIGTLLFLYLVADYSATLMLAERPRKNYIEMVTVIRQYLTSNEMLPSIRHRTEEYLALQWRINKGYNILKERSILFDAPLHLFEELQIAKFYQLLIRVPLFQVLDTEYIKVIAAEAKQINLPPNEMVMYAGEVVRHMYLIDRGFCELISAASGKTEKILGPMSHFCDFDMVLERPGIVNIRTVTHIRLVKISYNTYKKAFVLAGRFQKINQLVEETKSLLAVQRLFLQRGNVTYHFREEEQRISWFIFPRKKLHRRNIDYEKGFDTMGVWRFFKVFLLRRTIMPDGQFLIIWEAILAVRAIILGIYCVDLIFIPLDNLHIFKFLWHFLNVVGCIDLYIKMHICYYNSKGILVTHPKYTALHYLTGSFIIDLCSLLPAAEIFKLILKVSPITMYRLKNILRLNMLLQIYRIPGAFVYFERDILRRRTILLTVIKYCPLSILFFNTLAIILITMTCQITKNDARRYVVKPYATSWIMSDPDKRRYNVTDPTNLFISAYYWMTITGLQEGYGNFKALQASEMCFIIFVVVAGYLFFTYILVIISSRKASINVKLTLYQEHMKHLISFMKTERVIRELRTKVIDHFEYMWQRTHGMKASSILKKCHLALRQDSVSYLYEQTFMQVPVFADMSRSFYRLLGMHVEEAYFLKYTSIIRLNDIIDTLYIVHKGEVTIVAPDGSTFAILGRGSMFGNIDNVRNSRSMTSVTANKAVDLLCINTMSLYTLAADYSIIINRMRKHILLENLSYIEKKPTREQMQIIEMNDDNFEKSSPSKQSFGKIIIGKTIMKIFFLALLPLPMMLISFITCFIIMYHLAFQNHSYTVFFINYGVDVIHILKLYMGFYLPYRNNLGEFVTDTKMIRKRFLTPSRFYLHLIAILPFDIFAFAAPDGQKLYYLTWLRINRMLHMWNVYHFFNVTFDRLNINVLIIKLGSVCIYFMLMVHIGSCLLYMTACPRGKCHSLGWMYDNNRTMLKNNHYLASLYFMMAIITCTGFGDISPGTITELIVSMVIMLTGKFLISVCIGDISAIVHNLSYTLVTYDYEINTLKEYLQRSYIVGPLITRILNYVNQLWKRDRGLQLPVLLQKAPSCLLEDVKAAAYGKHLYENYIFVTCHIDFLRQLIAKLKAQTFFMDDIICQQGDVNNTMYFIHKGIVNVYDIDENDEIQVEELGELDCFGLVQGLFASTPHAHTYKAGTVAVILTLELLDWVHLLKFYRATRYEIYSRIQNLSKVDE